MTGRSLGWLATACGIGAGLVAVYALWGQEYIAIDRCLDAGGTYNKFWTTCDKHLIENPRTQFSVYTGPVFSGELNGQKVRLQVQDDFQSYRMIQNGLRTEGDVNTERGYKRDPDATVYVLNPWSEEDRQIRFLVSQNAGVEELVLLGPDGELQAKKFIEQQTPLWRRIIKERLTTTE